MELDQLQANWQQLAAQARETPSLNPSNVRAMTRKNIRSTLRRVFVPELMGAAACLYFAALFAYQFHLFDTLLLRSLAVGTLLGLVLLPLLRLRLLGEMYGVQQLDRPFRELYAHFLTRKLRFQKLQRAQAGLSFLLIMAVMVLATKVYHEFDVTESPYFWAITFALGMGFALFFEYRLKPSYQRAIQRVEALILDLE